MWRSPQGIEVGMDRFYGRSLLVREGEGKYALTDVFLLQSLIDHTDLWFPWYLLFVTTYVCCQNGKGHLCGRTGHTGLSMREGGSKVMMNPSNTGIVFPNLPDGRNLVWECER